MPRPIESESSSPRFSRRLALQGAAVATGIIVAGSASRVAGQIEVESPGAATPEAAESLIAPLPTGATIAGKAAELGYDVDTMFRFVRDEVRYEPYAGALRGANGALWSLAANSVDKTLLFTALLDEAFVDYRVVHGAIDDGTADGLMRQLAGDQAAFGTTLDQAQVAAVSYTPSGPLAATPPPDEPLSADLEAALDAAATRNEALRSRASKLFAQNAAAITDALSQKNIELPSPDFSLPDEERTRHFWVQVADGPIWTDYVLTQPDAEPGQALSGAPTSVTEVPSDLVHTVTVRVVAEEYVGGTNSKRDALTAPFASADLVNEPIALQTLPPVSLDGIGYSLNELLNGQAAYVPGILARDTGNLADAPLLFGGEGGASDILSGPAEEGVSLAEGETLAMWLEIDIASPGHEPVTVTRPLYDRIGFDARQAETIDFTHIPPVEMVTDHTGQSYVAGLTSVHQISVDSAYIPYGYAVRDQLRYDRFGQLVMLNSGMLVVRDTMRLDVEVPAGYRSFFSSPQITLVTGAKADPHDLTSDMTIEVDLMHREGAAYGLDAAQPPLHPHVLTGLANQISEQLTVEEVASSLPEATGENSTSAVRYGPNVGTLIAAALDDDIPVVALTSPDDLADLDLEPEAITRIEMALGNGLIVVAPQRSVEVEGSPRAGWWLIDPATGQTRDELDNGKGGASFSITLPDAPRFSPLTEETFVIRYGSTASQYYLRLSLRILCVTSGVGFGIMAVVAGSARTGRGTAGGVLGAAGAAGMGGLSC